MTRYCENVSRSSVSGTATIFGSPAKTLLLAATFLLVALGFPIRSVAESTISCPSGMYDMLDWMTLDSDLRSTYHMEGTSNPIYTVMQPGKFYWVKGGLGYPWDIQLYDSKYIYLWVTELSWTVPQSYKKFTNNTNLPLVPRCATAGTSTAGSTIKIANTNFDLHTNCSQTCSVTLGLQSGINQVWGPYYYSFGGSLPNNLKTLVISYRYNCDANYQNCVDKEEYYVSQRYGLVQWVHYVLANGVYAQLQKTIINKLVVGVVTPDFPCF
ncbi:MAG: hypothetical protein JWN74_2401 [Acidobacteriaceae bacterium]|nr:hypothetical protein [Acidobacteriaceae bacterium]